VKKKKKKRVRSKVKPGGVYAFEVIGYMVHLAVVDTTTIYSRGATRRSASVRD